MKSLLPTALAVLAVFSLGSCASTSNLSLSYVPGKGQMLPGSPEFTTRQFTDLRGTGPYDLGDIRRQIGMPLEHLRTRVPIAGIVTNAFGYALQGRGMLTAPSTARYIITGEVLDLHAKNQGRPYAYARLRVNVLAAGSGQILFSKIFEGQRQAAAFLPGSGSPVSAIRDLTSGALQDVVDRALDNGELRSRLGVTSPPVPGGTPRFVPGML